MAGPPPIAIHLDDRKSSDLGTMIESGRAKTRPAAVGQLIFAERQRQMEQHDVTIPVREGNDPDMHALAVWATERSRSHLG